MCEWFPCKKVSPYKRLPCIKGLPISGRCWHLYLWCPLLYCRCPLLHSGVSLWLVCPYTKYIIFHNERCLLKGVFWKNSSSNAYVLSVFLLFFLLKLHANILNLSEKWIWTILYQLCEWKTPANLHWADIESRAGKINRQYCAIFVACC